MDQERILAIRCRRAGFQEILSAAVPSNASSSSMSASPVNQQRLPSTSSSTDQVRLQWDPDHLPDGGKVEGRRALQLGLRGRMVEKFSRDFVVDIEDITDAVRKSKEILDTFGPMADDFLVPVENVYPVYDKELAARICLD